MTDTIERKYSHLPIA